MSKLFKVTLTPIMEKVVQHDTIEMSYRSRRPEVDVEYVSFKKIGVSVVITELTPNWSKEEKTLAKWQEVVATLPKSEYEYLFGFDISYPSHIKFTGDFTSTLVKEYTILEDFDDIEKDEFFVLKYTGMKTSYQASRSSMIDAPIKENRKGHHIADHLFSLSNDELREDIEFYAWFITKDEL